MLKGYRLCPIDSPVEVCRKKSNEVKRDWKQRKRKSVERNQDDKPFESNGCRLQLGCFSSLFLVGTVFYVSPSFHTDNTAQYMTMLSFTVLLGMSSCGFFRMLSTGFLRHVLLIALMVKDAVASRQIILLVSSVLKSQVIRSFPYG